MEKDRIEIPILKRRDVFLSSSHIIILGSNSA